VLPTSKSSHVSTHPMVTRLKSGTIHTRLIHLFARASPVLHQFQLSLNQWLMHLLYLIGRRQWLKNMRPLMRNNTWTLVPPTESCNLVGCKWVFRVKYKPDGSILKHKARLVAKGFHQTPGIDFQDTFSPVIKAMTIRIIFSLAVTFNWDVQQVDINNAFLNGDLTEDVYMEQPHGFVDSQKSSFVCKLNKALYGLKQAPRAWFFKLKTALQKWGFVSSLSDVSLFVKRLGSKVIYLLVYVDDILITGNDPTLIQQTITTLNSTFALKSLGSVNYFLGFEASRSSAGLF
jgi:hypothetical protein